MSSLAQRETFDIEDVAWSNGPYKSYIATASSNGKVILYDLERPGVRVRQLSEHQRQVHKVDFNKKEGAFLLSGSQDGDVKMWDLRVPRLNVQTYSGRSDGIRHVKWSPESTWSFCFGTDNGSLQRWDTRNTRQAALKIAAHTGTINSVDWHPDGVHLVSAGKDQNVKVWNLQADSSRYTVDPLWDFRTPHEIQNVRWRPPCFSTDSASSGDLSEIKQCTHLATSYKHKPLIHIWDLRRPHLPYRAVYHMTNKGTTDMMWRSKDLLLTVGPEGELTQSDVKFATKVEDSRPTSILCISARNELTAFVAPRLPPALPSTDPDTQVGEPGDSQSQPESSKTVEKRAEKKVLARSPGDDSFDKGFLPSDAQRKFRAISDRSPSTSTPTADAIRGPATQLNEVMQNYVTPSTNQLGFTISLGDYGLGFKHFKEMKYLAYKYKTTDYTQSTVEGLLKSAEKVFERNAVIAERVNDYRTAQTWRMLGMIVLKEVRRRAEINRAARIDPTAHSMDKSSGSVSYLAAQRQFTVHMLETSSVRLDKAAKAANAGDLASISTSFVQPITGIPIPADAWSAAHDITLVSANSSFTTEATSLLKKKKQRLVSFDTTLFSPSNQVEQDHYQRRALVNDYKMPTKRPFSLDEQKGTMDLPPRIDRADSDDSYLMFSNSSDSQPRLSAAGSFSNNEAPQSFGESRRVIDVENSDDRPGFAKDVALAASTTARFTNQPTVEEEEGNDTSVDVSELETGREDGHNEETSSYLPSSPVLTELLKDQNAWNDVDQRIHDFPGVQVIAPHQDAFPENLDKYKKHFSERKGKQQTTVQPGSEFEMNSKSKQKSSYDTTLPDLILADIENAQPGSAKQSPFSAVEFVKKTLHWYCEDGDAQAATSLYRSIGPLLATALKLTDKVGKTQAATMDKSFPEYITGVLGVNAEIAMSVLSQQHEALGCIGLNPYWVEAFLSSYHEQLVSLEFHVPAADLRRFAYPSFPSVYEQGLVNNEIGLVCLSCNNPINNPTDKLRCESCGIRATGCPICMQDVSPYETNAVQSTTTADAQGETARNAGVPRKSKLWSCCMLCGHILHTLCAHEWHGDPQNGGGCPTDGCLCDCVPGRYRRERWAMEEAEGQRRTIGKGKEALRVSARSSAGR